MQTIPLSAIANQELTVTLDNFRYAISLIEIPGQLCAVTITRDEVIIIQNVRAVANGPLLPYHYLEGAAGNFAFVTMNDDYPYWPNFGVTQSLVYASADELAALRNG